MKKFDVEELEATEMQNINGGWLRLAYAWAVDTIVHWETYKEAFKEGYYSVRN